MFIIFIIIIIICIILYIILHIAPYCNTVIVIDVQNKLDLSTCAQAQRNERAHLVWPEEQGSG